MSDDLIRRNVHDALDELMKPAPDLLAASQRAVRRGGRKTARPPGLLPAIGVVVGILVIATPVLIHLLSSPTSAVRVASPQWTTETRQQIRFSYPANWYENHAPYESTLTNVVASVSNQPLQDPCHTFGNVTTSGLTTACAPPLHSLSPGGVLVQWWHNAFPTFSFDRQLGSPATVGGYRAKIREGKPGSDTPACSGLNADDALVAVIEDPPAPDNYFQMTACMRGPGVAAERSVVMRILNSAAFLGAAPEPSPSPSPGSTWVARTLMTDSFVGPLALSPSAIYALSNSLSINGPEVAFTTLSRIDRSSYQVQQIDLRGNSLTERGAEIAFAGGHLWLLGVDVGSDGNPGTQRWVAELDPQSLAILKRVQLPNSVLHYLQVSLASDSNTVWVGSDDTLYWIDAGSGAIRSRQQFPGAVDNLSIDPAGQHLYVGLALTQALAGDKDEVAELNAATGASIATLAVGLHELSPPGVAATSAGVWIWYATGNMGTIAFYTMPGFRIAPGTATVHSNAIEAVFSTGVLWYLEGGSVACVNQATGRPLANSTGSFFASVESDATGAYAGGTGLSMLDPPPTCGR